MGAMNDKGTILLFLWSNRDGCRDRIDGVRRYARTRGWRVQIVERGGLAGRVPVRELLDLWHPAGCIAECAGGMPEFTGKALGGVPVVWLDENPRLPKARHAVVCDAEAIGRTAATELLSLGLESFAFAGYKRPAFWSRDRLDAFRRTLRMHGFGCSVFSAPPGGAPGRRRDALSAWIASLPRPCGVFAAHDPVGAEVLEAAKASDLDIPGDIAVVAVDDLPGICETSDPTITSIRPDFERGGYLAAEMLGRLVDDPSLPPEVLTYGPVHVTRRESTLRPRRVGWSVGKAIALVRRRAAAGPVSLADVASAMGCSGRQAEKRFHEAVGHSVLSEITAVRIEQAKALLRNPRLGIETIAMRCGWASPSSLRAAFRAATGMSPRQWRRTMS